MSDLGAKALANLLSEFDNHTNPVVKRSRGLTFKVVASLYHDCDRMPSYTTEDLVLDGLDRMEAEMLKGLLDAQRAANSHG